MVPRVLVILPTSSYRAADFVAAAEALGVELAIASEDEPPIDLGDRFVSIDCEDEASSAAAIADLAARTPIDAIVAADDTGVVMAAMASELLGLAHNAPEGAAATRDKFAMRSRLATAEISQPDFFVLAGGIDPEPLVAAMGGPVVIKPTGLSGSRGVIRCDDPALAASVADRVRGIQTSAGRSGDLLVERFVTGAEVAVEAMAWDGELEVLAVFDKPDPLDGPYFAETIYVTPSRHAAADLDAVLDVTRRAASALGITHGPVHAEVRVDAGRATLIEIAARSIGGLCGRSLRFGLMGTSLEVMILRQALGMRKESLRREPGASGVLMVPIPARGVLEGFAGVDAVLAIEGITGFEPGIPIGGDVVPLPEGDRYLGFVFARAATPDDVEAALRRAADLLEPRIV
jgi:biotin carboxylase